MTGATLAAPGLGGALLLDSSKTSSSTPTEPAEPAVRRRTITASRTERQFAVEASRVDALIAAIASNAPCTMGEGGGLLVTTVYFDDAHRRHLQASLGRGLSDRLRLREYPSPRGGGGRAYYVEHKRHLGRLTEKVRRRVEAAEAAALLANRRWAAAAFGALAAELGEAPLEPLLVVQYRRQTFGSTDWRVTLDREVSFFAPAGSIVLPLVEGPGRRVWTEPSATLEVKFSGLGPAWIAELCERLVPRPVSKFVRGCQALATMARAGSLSPTT